MTKRWSIRIGFAAALAVVAAVLLVRSPASPPPASPREVAASPPPAEVSAPRAEAPRLESSAEEAPAEAPPLDDEALVGAAAERARRSLELYRQTMVYPPWSRPADGSTMHLIDWNKPWPIGQPFAVDAERREIRADVSLDKLFAGQGQALTATLSVTYSDGGAAAAPEEVSGRVECFDPDRGWEPVVDLSFAPGERGWVARFTPSALPALAERPREARFVAHVRVGEYEKNLPQPFVYAAETLVLVRGIADEKVSPSGSLEVTLDVEFVHAAPTLFQAGLFDRSGREPIAVYDDYVRPTRPGRQPVKLTFFGKALRDAGRDGPYRIRALHGHVRVPGAVPPEVFWAHDDEPPLVTRRYAAAQFSGDAWASREKDEKIAQYEQLIGDLQGHR